MQKVGRAHPLHKRIRKVTLLCIESTYITQVRGSMDELVRTAETSTDSLLNAYCGTGNNVAIKARQAAAEVYAQLATYGFGNTRRHTLATAGLDAEQVWLQLQSQCDQVLSSVHRPLHRALRLAARAPSPEEEDANNTTLRSESVYKVADTPMNAEAANYASVNTSGENKQVPTEYESDAVDADRQDRSDDEGSNADEQVEYEEAVAADEPQPQSAKHPTAVDDEFFSLDDMERFVQNAERKAEEDSSKGVEEDDDGNENDIENDEEAQKALLGEDVGGGLEDPGYKYADLFGVPGKNVRQSDHQTAEANPSSRQLHDVAFSSTSTNDPAHDGQQYEEKEPASDRRRKARTTHEQVAEEMEEQARGLEEENFGEKEWYMRGEAKGKERPKDSALEVDLEYEHADKPAPEITEEQTKSLEELIRRRIRDQQFDDIVRILPRDEQKKQEEQQHKRGGTQIELNPQPSKKGLGQVYEEDYMRQALGTSFAPREDAEQQLHDEARSVFKQLCSKLDAMSHLNVSSAAAGKTADMGESTGAFGSADEPALQSEEALPTMASSESKVTPEEAYRYAFVEEFDATKAEGAKDDEKGGARQARKRARARAKRKARKRREADEQERAKKALTKESRDRAAREAGLVPPSRKAAAFTNKVYGSITGKRQSSQLTNSAKVFQSLENNKASSGSNALVQSATQTATQYKL